MSSLFITVTQLPDMNSSWAGSDEGGGRGQVGYDLRSGGLCRS